MTSPLSASSCWSRIRGNTSDGFPADIPICILCFLLILLGSLPGPVIARDIEPGRHPMTFQAGWDGSEQPYYLFVPSTVERPLPLAVVLHGKGANWRSWFEATTVCEWAEREGIAVLSPHGRGDWFYTGPGESDTLDAIREVKGMLDIDPDRVYLLGHSMGGWGAWHLGLSHPNLFAAIVPMATWPPVPRLAGARHLAPFLIHGAKDEIIPPIGSRLAVQHLEAIGIIHRYHESPESGHESSLISDSLDSIWSWLSGWKRTTGAPKVSLRTYTPRRGANQWLQLERVHRWTDLASIDADIRESHIDFLTENVLGFFATPPVMMVGHEVDIRIDGQFLTISGYDEGTTLHFTREIGGWKVEKRPQSVAQPPDALVLHQIPDQEMDLPSMVASALSVAVPEASLVLVPNDLVAPRVWPGDFTEDHLLDLFLHEEDQLYVYRMSAGEVRNLLERKDEWFPPWWVGLTVWDGRLSGDDDAQAVLVAPEVIGKRLPAFGRPSGLTLRRALYDVFRVHGFP